MRRDEQRAFLAICRQLEADDPDFARRCTDTYDRLTHAATRAGHVLLVAGLIGMLSGLLLDLPVAFGVGLIATGLFWLPRQLVRPDSPVE